MKKPAAAMTVEDIEHCIRLLKGALSVSIDHSRVDEILGFFEVDCKRVLSLGKGVPPKEIQALADANDVFWLKNSYPIYTTSDGRTIHVEVDLFSLAADALTAVYFLRDAFAHREFYADDFCTRAQEEADDLLNRLKLMRFYEAETRAAKKEWDGKISGRRSGEARREEVAERNRLMDKRAREMLASGAATPHALAGKLKDKEFSGKKLTSSRQVRSVLQEKEVLPPSPKRRKRR
jgi:hypothetical protein